MELKGIWKLYTKAAYYVAGILLWLVALILIASFWISYVALAIFYLIVPLYELGSNLSGALIGSETNWISVPFTLVGLGITAVFAIPFSTVLSLLGPAIVDTVKRSAELAEKVANGFEENLSDWCMEVTARRVVDRSEAPDQTSKPTL